tara:strand:- start:789 stop:1196 length:408 start_codon:yes stop_codon:yes gene_type:complete
VKQLLVALVAGALFGAGLAFSGMADPARVQGFLDLFGQWDPTLAFVMGGAMIPMALAWIIQRRLDQPFADANFSLPGTSLIDRKLAIGAVLFGAGWGICGLCPGPGLANLALNPLPALAFVGALLAGMIAHRVTS